MLKYFPRLERSVSRKVLLIACLDVVSICIAFFAALWLRFDFQFNSIDRPFLTTYSQVILPWCGLCVLVFFLFRLYSSIWSFVSTDEMIRILESYGLLAVIAWAWEHRHHWVRAPNISPNSTVSATSAIPPSSRASTPKENMILDSSTIRPS